jgi:hypothetical protein
MPRTKLICDTNVFYNLGAGHLVKTDISGSSEQICYSPLSVIEIAGKLSDRNFQDRRAAAQAIIDVGAVQLPDPESFRELVYGYPMTEPPPDFSGDVVAIAQSRDMESLQACVDLEWANHFQTMFGGQWKEDMLRGMGDIPGFTGWYDEDPKKRQGGPVPTLKDEKKEFVQYAVETPEFLDAMLFACLPTAAHNGHPPPQPFSPTPEQIEHYAQARDKILCHACVFRQYFIRLHTERALPEANDSIDLELFMYCIDDNHILVTSERKWVALAERAGYPRRVRKV